VSDATVRRCEHCDQGLVRRDDEGSWDFNRRKYCNRVCSSAKRRLMDGVTKPCEICGEEFSRRRGENTTRFRARQFCGRGCTNTFHKLRTGKHAMRCFGCAGILPHHSRRVYCRDQCKRTRIQYVISELDFLIGTDEPWSLAQRLGYPTTDALARMLYREGRPDLAVHFERGIEPSLGMGSIPSYAVPAAA